MLCLRGCTAIREDSYLGLITLFYHMAWPSLTIWHGSRSPYGMALVHHMAWPSFTWSDCPQSEVAAKGGATFDALRLHKRLPEAEYDLDGWFG